LNSIKIDSLIFLGGNVKVAKLKSAWEIAQQKVDSIKLSPEEIEAIKEEERIKALLPKFYKGEITVNDLWQELKGSKPTVLREAQLVLINSLNLKNSPDELKVRKEGILAIENLKENQKIPTIESLINQLISLQKEYHKIKDSVANKLKAEIKKDPKLRIKTVQQGEKIIIMRLSVEEALQENPQWKNFLSQHEEEYNQRFASIIERIKKEIE